MPPPRPAADAGAILEKQRRTSGMAVRSILFNLAFYVNLVLWLVVCLPAILLPRRMLLPLMPGWAGSSE